MSRREESPCCEPCYLKRSLTSIINRTSIDCPRYVGTWLLPIHPRFLRQSRFKTCLWPGYFLLQLSDCILENCLMLLAGVWVHEHCWTHLKSLGWEWGFIKTALTVQWLWHSWQSRWLWYKRTRVWIQPSEKFIRTKWSERAWER